MSAQELARKVRAQLEEWDPKLVKFPDTFAIMISARTTKTRASSMVGRFKLIIAELADHRPFTIRKRLCSMPPRRREDLANWDIIVEVPIAQARR
jgi:hypothetical protein